MMCDEVRAVLSARLDGEATPAQEEAARVHLTRCAGCRTWLARAEQITRAVRVQAVAVPDLTEAIMAARPVREAEWSARQRILRVAVAAAAAVQLVLALPVLLGGFGLTGNPHAGREMASFDIALAVGFALAAYRPRRARAFLPVAVVLAGCLAITSGVDVANASTALVHEVRHLAAVVQAGLLWALGRGCTEGETRGPLPLAAAGPTAQA
ncbi:MAG TPA: zf-HC2 domain-containing protein [Micromonosporaceae bacterium]|jgi:predicted anti-sigma-YlaC factor YlaD|nr:zf-HC2 domain-containing protein [Micromonosporaceae bacterium]